MQAVLQVYEGADPEGGSDSGSEQAGQENNPRV